MLAIICLFMTSCGSCNHNENNGNVQTNTPEVVVDTTTNFENDSIVELIFTKAEFPGGEEALMKYVSDSIVYPEDAINNEIEGRVIASFQITENGTIDSINIINGVYESIDSEVVRVIENMPEWTPAMYGEEYVRSSFILPVLFKLNEREIVE